MESPLRNAQWNKRIIAACVESDTTSDGSIFDEQYETSDWAGYADRDLILVEVAPAHLFSITALSSETKDATLASQWHDQDETGLRSRIGCDGSESFVSLIGKDGGVKGRWSSPVSNDELFALIDSMPMRQQEQRDNK